MRSIRQMQNKGPYNILHMKKINTYINKIKLVILVFLIQSTQFAFAQTGTPPDGSKAAAKVAKATSNLNEKTLQQLVADFILLLSKYVLKVLLAVIILVFLYGLMKYMFKGQGSDTARVEGRKLMLWGIIGIFVVTSIWTLVGIFASFVGHKDIVIPQFK